MLGLPQFPNRHLYSTWSHSPSRRIAELPTDRNKNNEKQQAKNKSRNQHKNPTNSRISALESKAPGTGWTFCFYCNITPRLDLCYSMPFTCDRREPVTSGTITPWMYAIMYVLLDTYLGTRVYCNTCTQYRYLATRMPMQCPACSQISQIATIFYFQGPPRFENAF